MRHIYIEQMREGKQISINAPLTGCDINVPHIYAVDTISIHAPLTGCDKKQLMFIRLQHYFNPRTPYGMRLTDVGDTIVVKDISIHAPLTGCD